MANKIVQLKDNGDNLYPLSVMLQPNAEYVTGAWTATSTSSAGTIVTENITLTKGMWVVYGQTPHVSTAMMFSFRTAEGTTDLDPNNVFQTYGAGYVSGVAIVNVTSSTVKMRIICAGSTSTTYTATERGCIKAVKVYESLTDTGVAVDYVVEQGTSGDWTYRKWNSGVSEGWYKHTYTGVNISSDFGVLKEGKVTDGIDYPTGLFNDVPTLSCTFTSAVFVEFISVGTASRTGAIYGVRPNTLTTANVPVNLYAIGTWK